MELEGAEKIFTEAGIQINDLLRMNYANVAYLGLGARLYYRYGAYACAEAAENLHYRILLRLAFD